MTLDFSSIPHVMDDDEVPFVLRFAPDPRPSITVGGAEYRRSTDRYTIDFPYGDVGLRAQVWMSDGMCYLVAFIGPLLNEWWPMLQHDSDKAVRPFLSAGVSRQKLVMTTDDAPVSVMIIPPSEFLSGTSAMAAIGQGLTEENMLMAHFAALGVIKAALLTLLEYRSLVSTVPDINLETGGATVELGTMLEVAAGVVDGINWAWVPS